VTGNMCINQTVYLNSQKRFVYPYLMGNLVLCMYHKEKWASMNSQDHKNSVQDELFSNAENIAENTSKDNASPSVAIITGEDEIPVEKTEESVVSKQKATAKTKTRKKAVKKDKEPQEPIIFAQEPQMPAEISHADEDTKPVTSKSLPDKDDSKEEVETDLSAEIHREIINYTLLSQEDLIKILEEIIHSRTIQEIRRDVEAIKVNFYKKHRTEIELKRKKFIEEGGLAEEFEVPVSTLEEKAGELLHRYRDLRMEYNRNQDDAKFDNLRMRQEIIEEIKELINSEESINKTFQEFRDLQNRWREIGAIPQQNINDLWETYHHHVEKFYDYIKINKELRDLDLKRNFESKIQLCEKAEMLLLEPNVLNAFASLQKFHEQWREIGPVPKEKRNEIWERFKEATSKINKKHQHYYQDLKDTQKKNLDSKILLSEKAEEIAIENLVNHKEWVRRTNDILELQKVWKTIGFAPKKENNRIYSRFRAACDRFFDRKRGFYAQNLEEQGSNLQKKLELCFHAEALQESSEWKKTTDEFVRLQRKWKEIGPAPRKHSEQIWKRFRIACDKFFARKAEYFSTIDNTFEKNLEAKEALIKEIETFAKTGNSNSDLEKLQACQRKWSEIGFVPFEKKDELQQRYRDAINKQFDGLEVDEFRKSLLKFRNRIEGIMQKPNPQGKLRFEREKYMIKLQQLKSDIGVWENNIGFFANTGNAEVMLKDFEVKIKEARETIHLLEEKITILDELNLD
jgi:triphosphoribosyl-dephospho-CoA synthetase